MKDKNEAVKNYFDELVTKIGEFRVRHMPYIIKLDNVFFTWADLGGDKRLAEWRVGKAVVAGETLDEALIEKIMQEIDNGKTLIIDYLRANYTLPSTCNERTWAYLADKCAKTISFGASWTQVQRYIEKELDYLENHPRDENGKRA